MSHEMGNRAENLAASEKREYVEVLKEAGDLSVDVKAVKAASI